MFINVEREREHACARVGKEVETENPGQTPYCRSRAHQGARAHEQWAHNPN